MKPTGKKKMRFKTGTVMFLLAGIMLALPALSLPADKQRVLEVRYENSRLSVRAVNAGAEALLKKVAAEARFKLVTSGFPKGVKVDVYFKNLPLDKGIDRIVKTLRKKASVSHIAMFRREEGGNVLYSLLVTYSKSTGERGKTAAPPPVVKKETERSGPSSSKTGVSKIETEKKMEADAKRQMRQEIAEKLRKQLRQEGWSRDEIEERLQKLLGEGE